VERRPGTDSLGVPFDGATVAAVWDKAQSITGYPPEEWRFDRCGRIIRRSAYGNTRSPHGWEIDHVKPVARGGGDHLSNLEPLHWELNREKADRFLWACP
jgi:5-methylcytosine-specific restriction endonuclease McrA